MRPTSVTVESQTTSAILPVNWRSSNFNLGISCKISTGANLVYKVQHTFDNVFDPDVTPVWFDHPIIVSAISNMDHSYDVPVIAIRLNVTSYVSGSVTLTIVSQG